MATRREINPFAGMPCRECGAPALRMDWRLQPTPGLATTGLVGGSTLKVTARYWPWCVCDHCGAASKGKPMSEVDTRDE